MLVNMPAIEKGRSSSSSSSRRASRRCMHIYTIVGAAIQHFWEMIHVQMCMYTISSVEKYGPFGMVFFT